MTRYIREAVITAILSHTRATLAARPGSELDIRQDGWNDALHQVEMELIRGDWYAPICIRCGDGVEPEDLMCPVCWALGIIKEDV